jgi:hypothetical protein
MLAGVASGNGQCDLAKKKSNREDEALAQFVAVFASLTGARLTAQTALMLHPGGPRSPKDVLARVM